MRIADATNGLAQAVVRTNPVLAEAVAKVLTYAELISVAMPCLCETVWVLRRRYDFQTSDVAVLPVSQAGGDFADGSIAYVSFDKRAVVLLEALGQSARLLCKIGNGLGMKRLFYLAFGLFGVLDFALPALLVARLMRLTSSGPALYWSDRVGKGNRIIRGGA
jgi:hypothetical protein